MSELKVSFSSGTNKKIDWSGSSGVILLDTLHNCSPEVVSIGPRSRGVNDNIKYARGVLVGLVAGLMHLGYYFDEAWEQILRRVEIDPRCIPDGWPSLKDYEEAKK